MPRIYGKTVRINLPYLKYQLPFSGVLLFIACCQTKVERTRPMNPVANNACAGWE
ncbi:hypothetical protein [Spirosoma humi]